MEEIFGLPTIQLMWIVVAIVGVAAGVIAFIFLKRPILVRVGLRNIPRRRAQTVLVTMGLTLATVIVTIAFSTGDSLAVSIRNVALDGLQRIDHIVSSSAGAASADDESDALPAQVLDDLRAEIGSDERVDAVFGVRWEQVPAEHRTAGQIETQFVLTGLDSDVIMRLETLPNLNGEQIDLGALSADQIVINRSAARELDAEPGDTISLYVRASERQFVVADVAVDSALSGDTGASSSAGGVVDVSVFEQLLGPAIAPPGEWSVVIVSAVGGVVGGLESSDALEAEITAALGRLAGRSPEMYFSNGVERYEVEPVKADTLEFAELVAAGLTLLFLFMGSFSVAAGVLLIFLIFAMLAEERKPEMGIARAVGMQRNDLIQMFISEGMIYNLGAAVLGVVLGLLFAIGMIAVLNQGFESFGFQFTWTVTLKSLVISAGIGVVITFITVVISSFRAARLNIVAAIRDIPESQYEETHPLTLRRVLRNVLGVFTTAIGLGLLILTPLTLIIGAPIALVLRLIGTRWARQLVPWTMFLGWRMMQWNPQWWALFIVGGLYLFDLGLGQEVLFPYMTGVSLVPLGVVMGLNKLRLGGRRLPQRALYTLGAGFVLFVWFIPSYWHEDVFSVLLDGGPELFVLAGTMLTAAGTLLLVFNLDLIVGAIRNVVGGIGRMAPVIRTAAAYPAAARYRTGMTIAMITLITFALVNFATINSSFSEAFTGSDSAGGFEVLAWNTDVNAVSDISAELRERGADDVLERIEQTGRIDVARLPGTYAVTVLTEQWSTVDDRPILDAGGNVQPIETDLDRVAVGDRDGVVLGGVNQAFIDGQEIGFLAISYRYDSAEDVWDALRRGEPVAVATADALEGGFAGFGGGSSLDPWSAPDSVSDDSSERLPRIVVELGLGDSARQVEVIGVLDFIGGTAVDLDGEENNLPTFLTPMQIARDVAGPPELIRHYISTISGDDSLEVAQGIERELRIVAVDIKGELEDQQRVQSSILALFQGFIGIGLVAGLAALGVIALRAVVERRQQIGVLRAIGFQARLVGFELMVEMAFIALLGLGLGTALALGMAWRLFAEGTFGDIAMNVPLGTILPVLFGAFAASLVLTYFPARQAARITIADALRYE